MELLRKYRRWRRRLRGAGELAVYTRDHVDKFTSMPRMVPYAEELRRKFNDRAFNIVWSDYPVRALRKAITESVDRYAYTQVLTMTDEIKREQFYRDSPYVSVELRHHLYGACEKDEKLIEWVKFQGLAGDAHAIFDGLTTWTVMEMIYFRGFNIMRAIYDDVPSDMKNDWFRPLVLSALIYEEHAWREKLGLPQLARKDDPVCDNHGRRMS